MGFSSNLVLPPGSGLLHYPTSPSFSFIFYYSGNPVFLILGYCFRKLQQPKVNENVGRETVRSMISGSCLSRPKGRTEGPLEPKDGREGRRPTLGRSSQETSISVGVGGDRIGSLDNYELRCLLPPYCPRTVPLMKSR